MKLNLNKILSAAWQFYQTQVQSSPGPGFVPNKIVILLSEQEKVDWLITHPLGAKGETLIQGDLSQLQPAEGDEVGVIVPGEEILLAQGAFPELSPYRLQQALPYALEEQVLDELELLHFASGPYLAKPKTIGANELLPNLPVAVVKKTLLEQWLNRLQGAGIKPDFITSTVFTLPWEKNQWHLLITNKFATVRTGLYSGFSSELHNLETLLTLKLQEEASLPDKLIIYQDENSRFSFQTLALPIERVSLSKTQRLELAAASLNKYPYLNLLQGAYTSARKLKVPERNKKAWQMAAYAFSLWLGLLFLSKLGSLLILSYEHHHLQNIISETYMAHFPQAQVVVDPKSRLESKLKKALAQSEKSRLFQWLGYLAKTASSIRIQSLNFQNNQLSLELLAPSFSSLDDLMLALKAEGLEVKQQSAAMAGNQVKAVLLIEGKSA